MMRETGKMPGYHSAEGNTQRQMAPHMVMHNGQPFVVVHAGGVTTGLIVSPGEDLAEGRIAMTTWCDGPDGFGGGTALTFTPDDDMLDLIIASLTEARDTKRKAAAKLASAALARAGAK